MDLPEEFEQRLQPPSSWRPLLTAQVRQQSDTTGNRKPFRRADAVTIDDDDMKPRAMTMHRDPRFLAFRAAGPALSNDGFVELEKYRLMEDIGQGSYGVVKLACNQNDNRLYALKVLDKLKLVKNFACFRRPPSRNSKDRVNGTTNSRMLDPMAMVRREIAILKKLAHPNVVKLIEVLDEPNQNFLYLVFEYVERGSVMQVIPAKPFCELQAWKYFRETFTGLEYLHHQKIIHRDIKPSNLLLTNEGGIKIADFGVSCEFDGIDAFLTNTAGAPAFMAPEALNVAPDGGSPPCYSGRLQDVWSLGMTLYAFVYGQVPFWDPYVIALHRKIKNDVVVYPKSKNVSDDCIAFMELMLQKDPLKRSQLVELSSHKWLTKSGRYPMSEDVRNVPLIDVTNKEIERSVRVFTSLGTLILIKSMGHRRSFGRNSSHRKEDDDHPDAAGGRLSNPLSSSIFRSASVRGARVPSRAGRDATAARDTHDATAARDIHDATATRDTCDATATSENSSTITTEKKQNGQTQEAAANSNGETNRDATVTRHEEIHHHPNNCVAAAAVARRPSSVAKSGEKNLTPDRPSTEDDAPLLPLRPSNGYASRSSATDVDSSASGALPPPRPAPPSSAASRRAPAADGRSPIEQEMEMLRLRSLLQRSDRSASARQ